MSETTVRDEYEVTHTLAKKLAHALGEGWQYQRPAERHWQATITHKDGARLGVNAHSGTYTRANERGKVTVHGYFERDLHDHKPYNTSYEINVTIERGIEAIAKEVQRRLLPAYLQAVTDAQAKLQRAKEHQAHQAAILDDLANRGNGERRNGSIHWYRYQTDGIYGEASVSYDDKVTIKLERLSVEAAQNIMSIVHNLMKGA